MFYFCSAVMLLWILTWVSWIFCLDIAKWFDEQLNYTTYDFDGKIFIIIVSVFAVIAEVLACLGIFVMHGKDSTVLLVIATLITSTTLISYTVSFIIFCVVPWRDKLARKKGY